MNLTPQIADHTGMLGAVAVHIAGLPPAAVYGYLLARLLTPILLIVLATRGATPVQRIGVVRDYLIGPAAAATLSPKTRT